MPSGMPSVFSGYSVAGAASYSVLMTSQKINRRAVLALAAAALTAAAGAQSPAPVKLAMIESLSGPFANTGEAVVRNIVWAIERVNARGGVKTAQGQRPLELLRYDSKGQNEEALSALRAAIDDGAQVILQGNSSAQALVLIDAINKHNEREPGKRVLFLNYSAVDPVLTNDKCSFWHFRFDAHADMRMTALMQVLKDDKKVKSAYLIGQDYSFGQAVLREAGFEGKFYTFYGNALGAPAAIGEAGVGRVVAVADWLPNVPGKESAAFYKAFRERFAKPQEDYVHLRMQLMIEALAQAIDKAASSEPLAVARQLEKARVSMAGQGGFMRPEDHQFQQPLVVGLMQRQGEPGVPFDVEGSGYGFRVIQTLKPEQARLPHTCRMVRPD